MAVRSSRSSMGIVFGNCLSGLSKCACFISRARINLVHCRILSISFYSFQRAVSGLGVDRMRTRSVNEQSIYGRAARREISIKTTMIINKTKANGLATFSFAYLHSLYLWIQSLQQLSSHAHTHTHTNAYSISLLFVA